MRHFGVRIRIGPGRKGLLGSLLAIGVLGVALLLAVSVWLALVGGVVLIGAATLVRALVSPRRRKAPIVAEFSRLQEPMAAAPEAPALPGEAAVPAPGRGATRVALGKARDSS